MKYNIEWQSRLTGQCGHGSKTWPKKIAEKYAKMYNQEYPDIIHWASLLFEDDLVAGESSNKESNSDNTVL